jgi:hypothetical protein
VSNKDTNDERVYARETCASSRGGAAQTDETKTKEKKLRASDQYGSYAMPSMTEKIF